MSTGPTPGWYHAEGDPPNTERYWDGTQWTEGPRPVGGPSAGADPSSTPGGAPFGAPGPAGGGLPGPAMGQPAMAGAGMAVYPEASKATTALVLSILGFLCCLPLAGVGAYMGRAEQQAIQAGLRDPKNQGMATAAFIIGLIAVAIWVLLIILVAIGSATGN